MRIPFNGPAYKTESVNQSAQRCVNLYLEQTEQGGKTQSTLYRTPGKVLRKNLGNPDPVRQMLGFGDFAYIVCGFNVYRLTTGFVSTVLGSIGTRTGYVSMACNGSQVMLVDGVSGWIIDIAGATLTQITDADFPNGVTWVRYFDGYFIVGGNNTKQFYYSSLNDGLTWDALDFQSAEADPSNITAGEVDHRELMIFGDNGVETFIDSGNADAPFQRAGNAYTETGCAAVASVAKLDNSVFFLGRDRRGDGIVYRMNGYTPQRISDFGIETAIRQYSVISDAVAFTYQQAGHSFYVLSFPTGNATWAYDASTGTWHERAYMDQFTGEYERDIANCYCFFGRDHLVGDRRTGRVYALDLGYYTDGGDVVKWLRSTYVQDSENNRVFYQSFELDIEAGVGTTTNYVTGGADGPAVPVDAYQATYTDTTLTPDATLTSGPAIKLAAVASYGTIAPTGSGTVSASVVMPGYAGGDTVTSWLFAIVNSGATYDDIEQVINSNPPTGTIVMAFCNGLMSGPSFTCGSYDGGFTLDTTRFCSAGDTILLDYDYATRQLQATVSGPTSLATMPAIPSGQFFKLVVGVTSISGTAVFTAGPLNFNMDETSGGRTGWQTSAVYGSTVIDPKVMLRWSDNGGHTWSNTKYLKIGKIGEYGRRAKREQLGAGRNRVWEISGADPVKIAVMGGILRLTAGDK